MIDNPSISTREFQIMHSLFVRIALCRVSPLAEINDSADLFQYRTWAEAQERFVLFVERHVVVFTRMNSLFIFNTFDENGWTWCWRELSETEIFVYSPIQKSDIGYVYSAWLIDFTTILSELHVQKLVTLDFRD